MRRERNGHLRALERALRRLAPEQGRIARRNARNAVLAVLRSVRRAMDAEYPAIRTAAAAAARRVPLRTLPQAAQEARLRRDGWAPVYNHSLSAIDLAVAGIKCRSITIVGRGTSVWGPRWAALVTDGVRTSAERVALLRRYRKDVAGRRAFLAVSALARSAGDGEARV